MVPFELRFISVIQNGRGILSFEHTFRGLSASAFESLVNFFQTLPVSFQPSLPVKSSWRIKKSSVLE
jgi:hypothetical protein